MDSMRFDLDSLGFEVWQLYCAVGTTENPGEMAGEQCSYKGEETGMLCTQGTECSMHFHTPEYRKILSQ